MIKKECLIFILGIFLISFASATYISFGDYMIVQEQDACFNIPLNCDNCTYMNITVLYPNGTVIIDNQEMSSSNSYLYNYTFCNTSILGDYWVISQYDDDGYPYSDTDFFRITPNGINITEGKSILYLGILSFLLIFLIVSIVGIFRVENYIGKLALYWVSHVLFIIWLFSIWQITNGFLIGFVGLAGIFKVLFYVSITAMFPMVLLSMAWIFYIHTMNDLIKGFMERGMDEQDAHKRAKEKRKW